MKKRLGKVMVLSSLFLAAIAGSAFAIQAWRNKFAVDAVLSVVVNLENNSERYRALVGLEESFLALVVHRAKARSNEGPAMKDTAYTAGEVLDIKARNRRIAEELAKHSLRPTQGPESNSGASSLEGASRHFEQQFIR